MSVPTSSDGGLASPGQAPQAGNPGDSAPAAGATRPTAQFKTVEEAEAAFQRVLKERHDANEGERAVRAELKKLQDAALSEEQRKQQELETLKEQSRQLAEQHTKLLVDNAVLVHAPKVGIDAELAQQLIRPGVVKVKDGHVDEESVKTALAVLLEKYPQLAVHPAETPNATQQNQRPPAPRVSATNPPASSVGNQPQYSFKNRPGWGDAIKKQGS